MYDSVIWYFKLKMAVFPVGDTSLVVVANVSGHFHAGTVSMKI